MEQYVVYVKDMLSPIMDFLENCGYDKHTLWGNIYNDFSSIMRFYEKLGFEIVGNLDNEYGDNIERYLMRYFVK